MRTAICFILTAPCFIWIGFWWKILEPDLYKQLAEFMDKKAKGL